MKFPSILLICAIGLNTSAQDDSKSSIYNLSLGIGPNYGMIGSKSVIGKKHTGLMVGLGVVADKLAYQIGGQIGLGSFYINAGYGVYEHSGFKDHNDVVEGYVFNAGVVKDLVEGEPFFINFGLGYSFGGRAFNGLQSIPINAFNVAAGIGFRFGEGWNSKQKDGFITI